MEEYWDGFTQVNVEQNNKMSRSEEETKGCVLLTKYNRRRIQHLA